MGQAALKIQLSIADYLEMERAAEIRHEFHSGEIFAMAGGTRNHALLGNAINTELNLVCRGTTCRAFNGDMRIRIESHNRFLYPEASVVCGPITSSPYDKDSITNPMLIAEVLSESTEAYDRGEKFRLYRTLPSLQEYVLIDQNRPLVEVFSRREEDIWEMVVYTGLEARVSLRSLSAEIALADLYRNVEWEENS